MIFAYNLLNILVYLELLCLKILCLCYQNNVIKINEIICKMRLMQL